VAVAVTTISWSGPSHRPPVRSRHATRRRVGLRKEGHNQGVASPGWSWLACNVLNSVRLLMKHPIYIRRRALLDVTWKPKDRQDSDRSPKGNLDRRLASDVARTQQSIGACG